LLLDNVSLVNFIIGRLLCLFVCLFVFVFVFSG